jgi:YD repeat-containing protein
MGDFEQTTVWDAASNLTVRHYSDGTFVTQQFDSLNRLTTAVDWAGSTTFGYSPRSEILGKTDPGLLSQAYRYDANSNRIGLTDPDGGFITNTYDGLDRVYTSQKQTGKFYTNLYDPDSRRTTLMMGSGNVRQYGLDPRSQITTQIDYAGTTPISTLVDGYDGVGNRVSRVQDGVPISWTYDNDYRLLGQQTAGGSATFTYNSVFSALVKWHQGLAPLSMTYDSTNRLVNTLQGAALTSLGYDGAGNRTAINKGPVIRNSYDPENRPIGISYPNGTNSTYTYQGYNGLRRSPWEPGSPVTTFVWDGDDYLQGRS